MGDCVRVAATAEGGAGAGVVGFDVGFSVGFGDGARQQKQPPQPPQPPSSQAQEKSQGSQLASGWMHSNTCNLCSTANLDSESCAAHTSCPAQWPCHSTSVARPMRLAGQPELKSARVPASVSTCMVKTRPGLIIPALSLYLPLPQRAPFQQVMNQSPLCSLACNAFRCKALDPSPHYSRSTYNLHCLALASSRWCACLSPPPPLFQS